MRKNSRQHFDFAQCPSAKCPELVEGSSAFSLQTNKVLVICCLLFLVIWLAGCLKREIKNINAKGTTIVCFGDSVTFGYGVNPGEDYPAALAKMVEAPVINAGIDGDTSTEGLRRLGTDALDRDPFLVIIEFGGNDFLRKIPIEKTIKNIEEMIVAVQARGAMAALADISISMIMGGYQKEFRRLAKKYNAIFIPNLLSGILTKPALKSDFIHPNSEGYKLIAQRVHRGILPYLKQNAILK